MRLSILLLLPLGCAPTPDVHVVRRADGSTLAIGRVGWSGPRAGGPIDESWTRRRDVAQHAWSVDSRPPGEGPLEFRVPVDGEVHVAGDTAYVDSPAGRWTYADPHAWDADGRELPIHFVAGDAAILVRVDDAGARYPLAVDPIVSSALVSWTGEDTDSRLGRAVVAGDFDGDGLSDVAAGAWGYDGATGRAYVFPGAAGGPSAAASVTLDGSSAEESFGFALAAADVSGDGYADLLVGSPTAADAQGTASLFLGSAAGLTGLSASTLLGPDADAQFGQALAPAGDVDADGYPDMLVGSPGFFEATGRMYLYGGNASGLDGSVMSQDVGGTAGDHYGEALAGVGDLNADGYADVVVGAYQRSHGDGAIYVYLGGATGLDTLGAVEIAAPDGASSFGLSVAGAGDQNADGYADVVVGAPTTYYDRGAIYVFDGSAAGLADTPSWSATGDTYDDEAGWAVAGGGDLNADGWADLLVGAPGADGGYGAVYTFSGGPGGLTRAAGAGGEEVGSDYGLAVGFGGDLDGDGYDDALVGAPLYDSAPGRAYVYQGYRDDDADGVAVELDCDDTDPSAYPGAPEVVADGIDQDCDGGDLCSADLDSDGFRPDAYATTPSADLDCADPGEATPTTPTGDCDDADASVNPGAAEVTGDEIDQDCDGREVCYADADADLYRTGVAIRSADADCTDAGEAALTVSGGDCDDADPAIHPDAPETVNDGIDQDCDGGDACLADVDQDGFRPDDTTTVASRDLDCLDPGEAVAKTPSGDCDDANPAAHPGADELVGDEVDEDCDGGEVCHADADTDGWWGETDTTVVSPDLSCREAGEAPEVQGGDCAPDDPTIHPGATEGVGDGVDQDCDGGELCYADADHDGYRIDDTVVSPDVSCAEAGEASADAPDGDCDDSRPKVHPGATELPDNDVDEDCDGVLGVSEKADEGCGCASGGAPGVGWLVVGLAGALTRRRRA